VGEVSIFKGNTVATAGRREPTALGKTLAQNDITTRRIQTNTNGTFRRVINGEQVGNAVRGEVNVIIVNALPKVSRQFYAKAYDPKGEPTLPDCWSNLGEVPEENVPNRQSPKCVDCKQNVKGSGGGDRRACRFNRRLSVLLEGDPSGEQYQLNVPAQSLFGKGSGNVHPFESYVKFLLANGESPDTVVTNVSYDLNAENMVLVFTPLRNLSDEEYELVQAAQAHPDADRYVKLTVAQTDKVTKKPEGATEAKAAVQHSDEPDDEDEAPQTTSSNAGMFATTTTQKVEEPTVRGAAKTAKAKASEKPLADVLSEWGSEDDEVPF
jgi:hypothetical protein